MSQPSALELLNTLIRNSNDIGTASYEAGVYVTNEGPTFAETEKFYSELLKIGKDELETADQSGSVLSEDARDRLGAVGGWAGLGEAGASINDLYYQYETGTTQDTFLLDSLDTALKLLDSGLSTVGLNNAASTLVFTALGLGIKG